MLAPNVVECVRNGTLVALFVVGASRVARAGRAISRTLLALAAFVVVFVLAQLTLGNALWYLNFLVAPIWIFAAVGATSILRRLAKRAARLRTARARAVTLGVALALLLVPEVAKARDERTFFTSPAARCLPDNLCNRDEVNDVLRRRVSRDTILMGGHLPWEIASAIDATVIPMLPSPEDLLTLRKRGIVVGALFVPANPRFAGDGARPERWYQWRAVTLVHPERFFDFRLEHVFSDNSLLYVRDSSLDTSAALPTCTPDPPIDLRRPVDLLAFSKEFEWWESYDGRAWTWLHGTSGRVHLQTCADVAPTSIRIVLIGTPNNGVELLLNGVSLGKVTWKEDGWRTVSFPIPPGAFSLSSSNELLFRTDDVNPFSASLAPESISFDR
jgi:hypothetical protein